MSRRHSGSRPATTSAPRLAAAQLEDEARRHLRRRHHRSPDRRRARTGSGRRSRCRACGRSPPCARDRTAPFEEDVPVVASVQPVELAADDAAQSHHPIGIGDHRHLRVERVGPCRRAPRAARPAWRAARGRRPPSVSASKTCSGRREIEGEEVGDVDERRDRPQPHRRQPILAASAGSRRCSRRGSAGRRRSDRPSIAVAAKSMAHADRAWKSTRRPARGRAASAGRDRRRQDRGRCRARRGSPPGSA